MERTISRVVSRLSEITYRTFLRRVREIADKTLEAYGLDHLRPEFITYTGNGLYRITVGPGERIPAGRYALRVHQPNYMKPEYIDSELDWLEALTEYGLRVPRPIRNLNDDWITVTDLGYDVPQKRNCTIVGWTEGRLLRKGVRPKHFRSLGRVMGEMHNQARAWKAPKRFARPAWDWEGLFGDGFGYGVSASDAHEAIPKKYQDSFNRALTLVRDATDQMGKGKDVYGVIHADLGLGDNVVFNQGEARPFDFDDCGFGYWIFDFAVLLSQYMMDSHDLSSTMRDSLLEGYSDTAQAHDIGMEFLDTFMVARIAQLVYFWQASGLANPRHIDQARPEIEAYGKFLKHLLKGMGV